jgi:hypothetical protein
MYVGSFKGVGMFFAHCFVYLNQDFIFKDGQKPFKSGLLSGGFQRTWP